RRRWSEPPPREVPHPAGMRVPTSLGRRGGVQGSPVRLASLCLRRLEGGGGFGSPPSVRGLVSWVVEGSGGKGGAPPSPVGGAPSRMLFGQAPLSSPSSARNRVPSASSPSSDQTLAPLSPASRAQAVFCAMAVASS